MRIPSGVVNSTAMPGRRSSRSRMSSSIAVEIARPVRLQHDQHVRQRVRHRIFGALGPAGAAHDVLDLRHLAQDVLDAVVQAIDLVERRLRPAAPSAAETRLRRAAA